MKLAKVSIENFRQLGIGGKPFELDFTDALGRVRDFTLLVGPNTSGKTTILDAIAAAIGPTLEMPTLRPDLQLSPRTVVTRRALHTRVTCWLRFNPDEVAAARELRTLAELPEPVPTTSEVKLTWTYPDLNRQSRWGFTRCDPHLGWTLLKARVLVARLLPTERVTWEWFRRTGGVFTFDQERTSLGKTVSREVWNIIHGSTDTPSEGTGRRSTGYAGNDDRGSRRTTDPRTILIDLALQSLVKSVDGADLTGYTFELIKQLYARVCAPRQIQGAMRDELDEFDIYFSDGHHEYRYDGLSSTDADSG